MAYKYDVGDLVLLWTGHGPSRQEPGLVVERRKKVNLDQEYKINVAGKTVWKHASLLETLSKARKG